MERRYKEYTEHKESNVDWLGKVPKHWELVPLRAVLKFRNEKNSPLKTSNILSLSIANGVTEYSEGERKSGNNRKEDLTAYKLAHPNDIVMNSMNIIVGAVGVSKYYGAISPVYYALYANSEATYVPYYGSIFHNTCFQKGLLKFGKGILIKTSDTGKLNTIRMKISQGDLKSMYFPKPPYEEQLKIAAFLDHETSIIDTLIAKQEKLIELLKEKRYAVITHAVTCGISLNAPLRHSGIEMLGKVPKHWSVTSLKRFICKMEQGKSPQCDNTPATFKQWGVLKTSCVNNGWFNENENKALPTHIEPHIKYEVKAGDILMSRASGSIKLIGSVARAPEDVRNKILLSDKVFRLFLTKELDEDYFIHLMASSYLRTLIEKAISGAEGMANNITKSSILDFPIPVPPLEEQKAILEGINNKERGFTKLISCAKNALVLLEERKSALISTVVTGKIDVRNWQK